MSFKPGALQRRNGAIIAVELATASPRARRFAMRLSLKLTLGQRLMLLLGGTLLAVLVAEVTIHRMNDLSNHENRAYRSGPRSLTSALRVVQRFGPELQSEAARALSTTRSQFFSRAVPGLHPDDQRDEAFEARACRYIEGNGFDVAEVLIATRVFHDLPTSRPSGILEERPAVLRIGDAPLITGFEVLRHVPVWVTGDIASFDQSGETQPRSDPKTGPPRTAPGIELPNLRFDYPRSAKVHTFAVRLRDQDQWTTLYRLNRPPPNNLRVSELIASLLAFLTVGTIAALLGRHNMRPLRQLRRSSEALGRGERAPEIEVRGASDVQEIVSAFNRMNNRVSQSVDYQVGLLRSIGHDLRGPLAAIERLVTQVAPGETREQIETRLDSVNRIVDAIMSFSRAVMRDGDLEQTDLAALLNAVVDEQADLGFDVEATAPDRLLVFCRVNATERCLRNLVENAVKHGGNVRAHLFTDNESVIVQIDDDGPGIPEDELEDVMQPFYRLAEDGFGSGLGLAIARTIAIDQGGSLTLSNRTEGGLRAELRLPYSPDIV